MSEIKAEGMTLDFVGEDAIRYDLLATFQLEAPNQLIETETKEFSAVCPYSGLPDVAHLIIKYYPKAHRAVELKSLKYYTTSYRNVGIYQEHATQRIWKDLAKLLFPEDVEIDEPEKVLEVDIRKYLQVTTVYNVRGGFLTTCTEGNIK